MVGGSYDKSKGYFIHPTIIEAIDPKYVTMCEEIFGPVLTIYVYDAEQFEKTLELVDSTSPYALTGSVIARDRTAVELATPNFGMLLVIFILMINLPVRWLVSSHLVEQERAELMIKQGPC